MQTGKTNIRRLLELYSSGKLEGDSGDIVRGWLLSDDDREEKEAALVGLFEKQMRRSGSLSDNYTRTSLARLHYELGFTDRNIRFAARPDSGRGRTLRYILGGAVAAAAVVAAVLVLPGLFDAGPKTMTTVVADSASAREVILPDGTTVELKAGAGISYDEAGFAENRSVEIDGEGFFIVTRDERHPFTVSAGDLEVTVLGTEFNIRAPRTAETAEVVLKSGSVEVAQGDRTLTLEPMQRATIDRTLGTITRDEIGEGEILRLRGLNLSFDDISLHDAFRYVGGFFDVGMQIAADIPATEGIVLTLEDDATLEDALFMLQVVVPVFDYRIENDTVTITKQ